MDWTTELLKEDVLKAKARTGLSIRSIAKVAKVSISAISRVTQGKEVNYSTGKRLEKWALWARRSVS